MGHFRRALSAYILKAKKSADSAFQSKKSAEKVRKPRQQNFEIEVRKSLKSLKMYDLKAKF